MNVVLGLIALIALIALVAAAVMFVKMKEALRLKEQTTSSAPVIDGRLDSLRRELTAAREETARKQKALDEVREEGKKKLRREGKKATREETGAQTPDARDAQIASLQKALAALEMQLSLQKKDGDRKIREAAEAVRGETSIAASREQGEDRARTHQLEREVSSLKTTLDELRQSIRKKAEDRPDIPGTELDLKSLPTPAVQELARFYRKSEELERLYHVTQGQVQLAQDRILELQRRYFAVCREMALAAGASPSLSDAEARKTAEGVLARAEAAASRPKGAPAAAATAEGAPADPAALAANGEAADPTRKKRRRRRRKKAPGEGGLAAGAIASGEDASADDGDDEGEDGDDDGHDEDVVTAPVTSTEGSPTPATA